MPALRERAEDIPLLVEHVLDQLGLSSRPEATRMFDQALLAELARHSWPGNVRELRNYVERAVLLEEPPALDEGAHSSDALAVDARQPLRVVRAQWTNVLERRYLEALLALHGGNVSAAARGAGVDRPHLYRLLWKHGLR